MAEKALTAVIQEAYIQDISTRSVDDLVIPSRLGIDTSMRRRPAHQRRRPFGLALRLRTGPFEGAAV